MTVCNAKKILVAEDDKVTRRLICSIIRKSGYAPIEATSGKRAWEILVDNPDTALLITDMMMPEMDGRELIQEIRKSAILAELPIIIVSGVIKLSEIVDLLERGASRFMPKPVNAQEAEVYIRQLVEESCTAKVTAPNSMSK